MLHPHFFNRGADSTQDNELLYQGKRYDSETNLYYYRARYYDPIMGRFLQTDPMGYQDSMNLYQAFNMNGMNFVDPVGENAFQKEQELLLQNEILKQKDLISTSLDLTDQISAYAKYLELQDSFKKQYGRTLSDSIYKMRDPLNPAYKKAVIDVSTPIVEAAIFPLESSFINDAIIWGTRYNFIRLRKEQLSTTSKVIYIISGLTYSYLKMVSHVVSKYKSLTPKFVRKFIDSTEATILNKFRTNKYVKKWLRVSEYADDITKREFLGENGKGLYNSNVVQILRGLLKGAVSNPQQVPFKTGGFEPEYYAERIGGIIGLLPDPIKQFLIGTLGSLK